MLIHITGAATPPEIKQKKGNMMVTKPAPIPTLKEVVWALHRAKTETNTTLATVWFCRDQRCLQFWQKVEDYLLDDLYTDVYDNDNDNRHLISRYWVRRFIVNNWAEVAIELKTLMMWGPLNVLNSDIQRVVVEQKEVIVTALDNEAA